MSVNESDRRPGPAHTAEEIVALFQSQGRRVVATPSGWWYNAYGQKRVYFSFPPHRLIEPSKEELGRLFREIPEALALRFLRPAPGGTSATANSFLWVRRKPYGLESLSSNSRSKVRRGLNHCVIRPISFSELLESGQRAQADTRQRQGKAVIPYGVSQAMQDCPAYRAWGAFIEDQLAAFVVTLRIDDWVHIQVNRSVNEFLKHYPNNALIHSLCEEMLADPEISAVCYGWESLTEMESLDQFKSSMGFAREPAVQQVVLAPRIRLWWNPLTKLGLRLMRSMMPTNERLRQVAGLSRFIA